MRIAMTLVVRDEVDVVAHWLRYHLACGVDLVLATDHRSVDGTSDILRDYERSGRVVVQREEGDVLRQAEWVTHMARLAALEHDADWVIPSDADEFWWSRAGSFAEILDAVPEQFGVVRGLMRHFVHRPGDEPFFERMTVRARPSTDLSSPYHAQVKIAHRAVADARVSVGNHDAEGTRLRLLREWFPFEVLHFPIRDDKQLEAKFLRRATSPDGQHIVRALDLLARGKREQLLAEASVDDSGLETGLHEGALVADVRLRDALRVLGADSRLPSPPALTPSDDADLAQDAHVALERDSAVLAEQRCAALEHAVAVLEGSSFLAGRVARRFRPPHAGALG
jgi:Glycosyl transferase family 2